MAEIDKVCEFSGAYVGSKMYEYRYNFIQVDPKHLHLFKGKQHVVVYWKSEDALYGRRGKWGGSSYCITAEPGRCLLRKPPPIMCWYPRIDKISKPLLKGVREGKLTFDDVDSVRKQYSLPECTHCTETYYTVYVPDVLGNVDGEYTMWTYSKSKTERQLRNLFGTAKLNIVNNRGVRNEGNYRLDKVYYDRMIEKFYGHNPGAERQEGELASMLEDVVVDVFSVLGLDAICV